MARLESKAIMGYLPIEERHYAAILSLVAPAPAGTRLLDPFAGEGAFLEAAATAWQALPYANELDASRAEQCIARFGPTQAVRCDVERLVASTGAFGILWANPPYDHDRLDTTNSKRLEFVYLRHAWKWVQVGGLVMWVIYKQHLTLEAATFLARQSQQVDVWALPGKHLGEYDQMVVVAVKAGVTADPDVATAFAARILAAKESPLPLTVQAQPVYTAPPPAHSSASAAAAAAAANASADRNKRFVFAADMVDPEQGLRLIQPRGAWLTHGFQALLRVPPPTQTLEPIVPPRPGHMALLLAAGLANGAILDTEEYGLVAVRGKTVRVEQITRTEVDASPEDPEREVTKTTLRLKPSTTICLISQDGTRVEMEGDAAILDFITRYRTALVQYLNQRFKPMYQFDFNGLGPWLDRVRLKGKHQLYTAQKHVIGALSRGFAGRRSILLVGQMGVGKTALGGSTAIALASRLIEALSSSSSSSSSRDHSGGGQMRADQVVLIVTPPHLIDKWQRELYGISPAIYVERLDRHEDIKAFMDKAARLEAHRPKIGLLKRDLTKLGAARETAVVWRQRYEARWSAGAAVPTGWRPADRLIARRLPYCAHCGRVIQQDKKGQREVATDAWLNSGKRTCPSCLAPLWQESRGGYGRRSGQGQRTAAATATLARQQRPSGQMNVETGSLKNPRYRLDEYLKRRYPDRVYLLIWDEVHEAAHGDTGNGEAFARLAGLARKVLAMTGTPFNGRASSLFNIEYALNPRVRARYAWGGAPRRGKKLPGSKGFQEVVLDNQTQRGRAEARWVADMGVQEKILEERPTYDRQTGAYTGTSTYERPYQEAPGISPLLVAELLDHAVFFSLGDLGKWLPQYEEIALPVDLDADALAQYKETRQQLIDYLVSCRWEGDTTFRGAYLQWAMGWPNSTFRPYEIIHNRRDLLSAKQVPQLIKSLPSFGEDRTYSKEQALVDLVRQELQAGRPLVIFVRQTATRDIQPRLASLLNHQLAEARVFILKNTVPAERREKVIEAEVAKGVNVVICNPELVKTGLDLIFAPTLVFYEIVFNLGTMMQAAGRSLRLNQTQALCKTYYLFCRDTMEHTAVELMSRKQRAAKLLNGDIGLTGLDALTDGESSFEEALLSSIGQDTALLDPKALFTTDAGVQAVLDDDLAYWNREQGKGKGKGKGKDKVALLPAAAVLNESVEAVPSEAVPVLEPAAELAAAELSADPSSALKLLAGHSAAAVGSQAGKGSSSSNSALTARSIIRDVLGLLAQQNSQVVALSASASASASGSSTTETAAATEVVGSTLTSNSTSAACPWMSVSVSGTVSMTEQSASVADTDACIPIPAPVHDEPSVSAPVAVAVAVAVAATNLPTPALSAAPQDGTILLSTSTGVSMGTQAATTPTQQRHTQIQTRTRTRARRHQAPPRQISPLSLLAGKVEPKSPADGTLSAALTDAQQLTLF